MSSIVETKLMNKSIYTRVVLIFVILIVAVLNVYKIRFGMDFIVLSLAMYALVIKESKQFVKDWWLPISLFYLYEAVRAKAFDWVSTPLGIEPIVKPLIDIERKLFFFLDEVPSVKLQHALHPNEFEAHWYDYILFFFYVMFFWYWLVVGFILWLKKRELFKPYMYGLVIFSLVDVVLYAFFPSAPPWYGYRVGFLPEIHRILWSIKYLPSSTLSVVSTYGRNDFAAFPSHHVAWPFFATLFMVKLYGKKALPLFIVPLAIAFATWYGAEHYVIDSIAGMLVATISFYIAINWTKIKAKFTKLLSR